MSRFTRALLSPQMSAATGDVGKAKPATASLFALVDRQPVIDNMDPSGLAPETCLGAVALRDVEFEYPTRPGVTARGDGRFLCRSCCSEQQVCRGCDYNRRVLRGPQPVVTLLCICNLADPEGIQPGGARWGDGCSRWRVWQRCVALRW